MISFIKSFTFILRLFAQIFAAILFFTSLASAAAVAESNLKQLQAIKAKLPRVEKAQTAKDFRLILLPIGSESRTGRDELGNSTSTVSSSWAVGLAWKKHQLWYENPNSEKSESSNGSIQIKNETKEFSINYRYNYYQANEYLGLSVGGGLVRRQQITVSEMLGQSVTDQGKDQIYPEFILGLSGHPSILFYDLGLKTIFQNDQDLKTVVGLHARAGLSFRF